jgi:hypothetical protein
MKLAIMQPYFFPYIGYFQLLANCDKFIFFDIVKYNKRSWMARNRIMHPRKLLDFQYVGVPIIKSNNQVLINDVKINQSINWKQKIIGQLTVYKSLKAPFYEDVIMLVNDIFSKDFNELFELNVYAISAIFDYLGINFEYDIASELNLSFDSVKEPGDWALFISSELGATEYVNPCGGYDIFDDNLFNKNSIKLSFIKSKLSKYNQSWRKDFLEGLSMIDVLMFNSKSDILEMLYMDFEVMNFNRVKKIMMEEI